MNQPLGQKMAALRAGVHFQKSKSKSKSKN
jgi:hypothetical protein